MSKNLSMKERASLATKVVGSAPPVTAQTAQTERKVHSGPGNSILAMLSDARVGDENKSLKEELRAWDGALPVRKLNASMINTSRWSNRHEDSFNNADFKNLKADIELAGGNVQAIKVRPIPNSDPQQYEIVFGHRRHRACRELDLPVLALIEAVSEQELFVEMDRENRQRADLRPYEQGEMYRRALDDGLYPSMRKLAEALGVEPSNVSRAVNIARLPIELLDAFPRLEIQYRWIEPLTAALEENNDALISIAKTIIERRKKEKIPAKEVFDLLTNKEKSSTDSRAVWIGGTKSLTIKTSKSKVSFELSRLSDQKIREIEDLIVYALIE